MGSFGLVYVLNELSENKINQMDLFPQKLNSHSVASDVSQETSDTNMIIESFTSSDENFFDTSKISYFIRWIFHLAI